jgi:hypothetical protein
MATNLGLTALPRRVFSSLRPLRLCVSSLVVKFISRRGAEKKKAWKFLWLRDFLAVSVGNESARPAPIPHVSRNAFEGLPDTEVTGFSFAGLTTPAGSSIQ